MKCFDMDRQRISFDIYALLLFLLIMLPNLIWFAVPAPNDVLRVESVTKGLDMVASVCQMLMIVVLCFLKNPNDKKICLTPLIIAVVCCCVLYFTSWAAYYTGSVNAFVILGLTIPPCLAFLFYAIDRKNWIAVILASIFTVCHLIYGLANFIA